MHKKLIIGITLLTLMLFAGLSSAAEMVNINKASAAAIQQNLVGIGPIKAEAIVSYRKKNGKFKSMDDLQNVTGLGPALIKKNKRYVSMTKGVVAGDDKAYAASKKQAGKSKATGKKKPAKNSSSTASAKTKSTTKTKTNAKKDSKTKVTAKPSKSAKKGCTGSTKTMSKAEKKACAKKKAKTTKSAKKPAKKKTTKKKKKASKPAS